MCPDWPPTIHPLVLPMLPPSWAPSILPQVLVTWMLYLGLFLPVTSPPSDVCRYHELWPQVRDPMPYLSGSPRGSWGCWVFASWLWVFLVALFSRCCVILLCAAIVHHLSLLLVLTTGCPVLLLSVLSKPCRPLLGCELLEGKSLTPLCPFYLVTMIYL